MADDTTANAETGDRDEETAAEDTDAAASTGSMTEEPPEEGASAAAEPAEAAGPESQADQPALDDEAGADPDPSGDGLEHTRKNDVDGHRRESLTDRVREHSAVRKARDSNAVERARQSNVTEAVDTSDPVVLAAVGSVLFSWYQFYVRGDREYGLFVGLWAPTLLAFADYLQNANVAEAVEQFRGE